MCCSEEFNDSNESALQEECHFDVWIVGWIRLVKKKKKNMLYVYVYSFYTTTCNLEKYNIPVNYWYRFAWKY